MRAADGSRCSSRSRTVSRPCPGGAPKCKEPREPEEPVIRWDHTGAGEGIVAVNPQLDGRGKYDPSRTRQSPLTLATFRSWGIHWMTPHEGPYQSVPDESLRWSSPRFDHGRIPVRSCVRGRHRTRTWHSMEHRGSPTRARPSRGGDVSDHGSGGCARARVLLRRAQPPTGRAWCAYVRESFISPSCRDRDRVPDPHPR